MSCFSDTPSFLRYGNEANNPSTSESDHTSWLPTAGNTRPSIPAFFISSSGGGNCCNTSLSTSVQYGLSDGLSPCLPHHTKSPVFKRNVAFPVLMSLTTSRATHWPPSNRNIVRRTPGNSFMSSTEAEVIQPLSTVSVVTSLWVSKGMTTCTSSRVDGS